MVFDYNIDFRDFVQRIFDNASLSGKWLYRGQSSCTWGLDSSYLRYCRRHQIAYDFNHFLYLLEEFIQQVSHLKSTDLRQESLAVQIAIAQHYGLPTPFLDWTESPYIAVYFALCKRLLNPEESTFTVWALKTDEFDTTTDIKTFSLQYHSHPFQMIRVPIFNFKRPSRQLSWFTFLNANESLNTFAEKQSALKGRLIRYDLSGDEWWKILEELRLMGITASSLFDSIDAISSDIQQIDYVKMRYK
jgi:hypothetical protein